MKKIKIFLGSSITDLHEERLEIESFVQGLNNKYIDQDIYINIYACEETSGAMAIGGSQSVHDKFITDEADATFFMFFHKAGEFTLHELELARSTFIANKNRPNVFVFFKTIGAEPVDNDEIKAVVDKIANEYAHYYKSFEKADTVKLEILQYVLDMLPKTSDLIIKDGKVLVDSIPVDEISANNIFAYENNPRLLSLSKEIDSLKVEMAETFSKNDFNSVATVANLLNQKQEEYNKLEANILSALKLFYTKAKNGEKSDPIRMSALRLIEKGNVDEALIILRSLNQIKNAAEKINLQQDCIKDVSDNLIEDAKLRIKILEMKEIKSDTEDGLYDVYKSIHNEIYELYNSVYEIAKRTENTEFLYDFVRYCQHERNDIGKAIEIAEYIKYICSNPDNKDNKNPTGYLDLLAELYGSKGDEEKAASYYNEMINIYSALAKEEKNETRYMPDIEAVYNSLAIMYSNYENFNVAEYYFIKAIDIFESYDFFEARNYWAGCYHNLAALYYGVQKYDKAIEYDKKAITTILKLSKKYDKDVYEPDLANVYFSLGQTYSKIKGHEDDSTKMYRKAEVLIKKHCANNKICAFLRGFFDDEQF